MKKFKIVALMLALVTFLFAGCSIEQTLKLEKSNFTAAEFYGNIYLSQSAEVTDIGNINVSESEQISLMLAVNNTMGNEYDILSIVCAMDFHIELSENSENSEKSKIYEFTEEQSNVVVNVIKKSSSSFTVKLYFTQAPVTELENAEVYMETEVKLVDVSKKINYFLKYIKDGVSNDAEFTYDQSNGNMRINLEISTENITNNITREIYDYAGNVSAIRTTTVSKIGGVKTLNNIFEIMKSPFLIRQKIGELNGDKVENLKEISEAEIAVGNTSDKWCYVLTAKGTEEGAKLKWQTSFNKYGSIN